MVLCPDLSADSPLVRLLEMKRQNDIDVDFGMLYHCASKCTGGPRITPKMISDFMEEKMAENPGLAAMSKKYINIAKKVLNFYKYCAILLLINYIGRLYYG